MSYILRNSDFIDGTVHVAGAGIGSCGPYDFTYSPAKPDLGEQIWKPDDRSYQSPRPPKDKSSFTKIKRSGQIKMTPYAAEKWTEKFYVAEFPVYSFALGWPHCDSDNTWSSQVKAVSSWNEAHVVWEVSGPDSQDGAPDIESELNSLRSNVVKASLQSYDLLTDLAEAKETAEMIMSAVKAVRHPLESFINFRKSLLNNKGKINPKKVQKMIEEKWMEYRYGIMPAYYSIRDIIKTLREKNNVYKTDRARKTLTATIGKKPDSKEGIYSYTIEEVTYQLNCTAKASYNPAELNLRLLDQIGFNPFVTAWELVPYSFVIDWFANVGDWVLAQTAALNDGAQQRVFCESIKKTSVMRTYMVANVTYKAEKEYSAGMVVAGPYHVNGEQLVHERRMETYSRNLFVPSDVYLQFDVFLNWKRMIDGWVLGHKPVISGLRRLRSL